MMLNTMNARSQSTAVCGSGLATFQLAVGSISGEPCHGKELQVTVNDDIELQFLAQLSLPEIGLSLLLRALLPA